MYEKEYIKEFINLTIDTRWHSMVEIELEKLLGEESKTGVVTSEKVKTDRENLIWKMTRVAYEECKDKIRDEGTLVGAGCVCKKLVDNEWQRKILDTVRIKVK